MERKCKEKIRLYLRNEALGTPSAEVKDVCHYVQLVFGLVFWFIVLMCILKYMYSSCVVVRGKFSGAWCLPSLRLLETTLGSSSCVGIAFTIFPITAILTRGSGNLSVV